MIFLNNKYEITNYKFLPKLEQIFECLERWNRLDLTPIGEIAIIKTFALPELVFPITLLNFLMTKQLKR